MITDCRKKELILAGYEVEDLGNVYGPQFQGMYRWINKELDDFQDGCESYSEDDAWILADEFEQHQVIDR